MTNSFKSILLGLVVASSQHVFAGDSTQIFEQTLGLPFNDDLTFQDLSKSFPSPDGTLAYVYLPKNKISIPFKSHSAYLTPTSKLVAIIEATKIEKSVKACESTLSYFTNEVADRLFGNFKTLDALKEMGYTTGDSKSGTNIQIRFDPDKNYSLQFGCVPSNSEVGKYAFIVSFSANDLKEVVKKEYDQMVATKG